MSSRYIVAFVILLSLSTVIITGCTQARSVDGCPVALAYTDDTNEGYTLNVYIVATNVHKTVVSRKFQGFASVVYYDKKSGCWFVEEDKVVSKRTVKICGKKATPVKVAETPLEQPILSSHVKSNGKLSISFLNKRGKLVSERELSIPGASITDCSSISWSPVSGYIAAELLLKHASESQLYLFDRNSHLKARIGRGSGPQFIASGRRLIYQDMSWTRSSNKGTKPSGLGTGNAVIYDIRAHTKRVVDVAHSPDTGLDGIADCISSPDGNWLVCSYPRYPEAKRAVFVVDIRNSSIKWHRLPINVYDGQWILLDKAPRRF